MENTTTKEYSRESFRFFKLISGEDVIAVDRDYEQVEMHPTPYFVQQLPRREFCLVHPMRVTIMYTEAGGARIGLSNWLPYSNAREFWIAAGNVMSTGPIKDDMARYYSEAIGQREKDLAAPAKSERELLQEEAFEEYHPHLDVKM